MNSKKPLMIYVLKVLEEYSDIAHFLTQKDIADKIELIYGVDFERKAIANSLELLGELGYDIYKNPKGGVCLLSRNFEKSEAQFLSDAIYSSRIITQKQSKELSQKVLSSLSKYERKSFVNIYKTSEHYDINQKLFYNIEVVGEAIETKKKISFNYIGYDIDKNKVTKYNNKKYIVNPYYLINNFGKYYLLCNYDKFDDKSIYRLDFLDNIEILNESIKPIENVSAFEKDFNITKYINDHIYIFGGKVIEAKVKLYSETVIGYVYDWFGKNANIFKENDIVYATIICNERAFFYWAMQYSEYIEVIEPKEIRNRIRETVLMLCERYKE